MLTDEQLGEIARESVSRDHGEYWTADIAIVRDPPGAWIKPRHVRNVEYTGAPGPFFIDRVDGLITEFPHSEISRACRALMELYGDDRPEVWAILQGNAVVSQLFEIWVRLLLVGARERYSKLSVLAPAEDTKRSAKPALREPWWRLW